MKRFFLVISILMDMIWGFAQRPPVTPEIAQGWGRVDLAKLSNNGRYLLYQIGTHPRSQGDKLFISSTSSTWKKEFREFNSGFAFTADSRMAVGFEKENSLLLVSLGSDKIEHIQGVSSFKIPEFDHRHWLAYQRKDSIIGLVLRNLSNSKEWHLGDVKEYQFFEDGSGLILNKVTAEGKEVIAYIDLKEKIKEYHIWTGENMSQLIFDRAFTRLSFIATEIINGKKINAVWCYTKGENGALKIFDDYSSGIGNGYTISKLDGFTVDGQGIVFLRERVKETLVKPNEVGVDVWSYTDAKLQSNQLWELNSYGPYASPVATNRALASIEDGKIVVLEEADNEIILGNKVGNYALVLKKGAGHEGVEWNWNKTARVDLVLVNCKNGLRKKVLSEQVATGIYGLQFYLTPDEDYIVYFDSGSQHYFSYNIETEKIACVTKDIQTTWTSDLHRDEPDVSRRPFEPGGFIGGRTVILYSREDIFAVDASGENKPVNLTNNYGKQNNITFRLAMYYPSIKSGDEIILNAFDKTNYNNGFYRIVIGKREGPLLLTMQPCIFLGSEESKARFDKRLIEKANNAKAYLLYKQTASSSPNLLFTTDFRSFKDISNYYPEKSYDWLTSELHTWKAYNGDSIKGILYKPQSFNPAKKYPVIFYYYERLSDGLHGFMKPENSNGVLNPPYFVNNGYLVFIPDVPKILGHPGASAVNAVVSAADYLSQFSWVDSTKMGITGHSFGGFETNYIITHSNKFAAAVPAASMSDFISCYGSIFWLGDGTSRQRQYEVYHDAIGASMWERPDLYIENSPVLYAHKVTTPVLMMHNKGDGDVPFAQGVEFFTALRRLGKKAWMLQYDGEDHALYFNEMARKDFTIRVLQFFDHYLKDKPAPIWMTRGIPAKYKGIKDGLEYDTEIKTPGEGLLLPEEKQKIDSFKYRKPFTITIP